MEKIEFIKPSHPNYQIVNCIFESGKFQNRMPHFITNIFVLSLSGLFVIQSFTLTLKVTGINDIKGELVIGIFDNQKDWLKKGHEFYKKKVKVTSNEETIVFKDLPPGEYAVSLYHDVNEDDKCNRNLIGYPTEGIGFSNEAKISIKAPGFKKASFTLQSDLEETIKLKTKK